MKRIAIIAAFALAGCSEDSGPNDPNLWLADEACNAPLVVEGSTHDCGGRNDHDACVHDALSRYGDPVCGLVAARVDFCGTRTAVACTPDGSYVRIDAVDCSAEVADYYACLDAKKKGRTKPWPIGGDADARTVDGGLSRDGSADAN